MGISIGFLDFLHDKTQHYKMKKHLSKGCELLEKKDYTNAIIELEHALRHYGHDNTLNFEVLDTLGGAYYSNKEYKKALGSYTKCITLTEVGGPLYIRAYIDCAEIYNAMGEYDEALKSLDVATTHISKPDFDMAFTKGVAHGGLGQYKAANDSYDDALTILSLSKPSYETTHSKVKCLNNKAWFMLKAEQVKAAQMSCDEAITLNNTLPDQYKKHMQGAVHDTRGHIHLASKEYAMALPCFQTAIDSDIHDNSQCQNAFLYLGKAYAHFGLGDIIAAVQCVIQGSTTAHDIGITYNGLASADTAFVQEKKKNEWLQGVMHNMSDMFNQEPQSMQNPLKVPLAQNIIHDIVVRNVDREQLEGRLALYNRMMQEHLHVFEYWHGFVSTFSQTFTVAQNISEGVFEINPGTTVKIFSLGLSFISSGVSKALTGTATLVKGGIFTRHANAFLHIMPNASILDAHVERIAAAIVEQKRELLLGDATKESESWWSKISTKCEQLGQGIQEWVYGAKYDSAHKKIGHRDASMLIQEWVEHQEHFTTDIISTSVGYILAQDQHVAAGIKHSAGEDDDSLPSHQQIPVTQERLGGVTNTESTNISGDVEEIYHGLS